MKKEGVPMLSAIMVVGFLYIVLKAIYILIGLFVKIVTGE